MSGQIFLVWLARPGMYVGGECADRYRGRSEPAGDTCRCVLLPLSIAGVGSGTLHPYMTEGFPLPCVSSPLVSVFMFGLANSFLFLLIHDQPSD